MEAGARTPCLDPDEILAFLGGAGPALAERVQRHVDGCDECRALLSEAVRTCASLLATRPHAAPDVSAPTDSPERVGRFVLQERVGAGASGVVFRAHDPQLERSVAVKLLRADGHPGMSAGEAEARFLREARAMARVNHPNVVVVHEVGSAEGRVYVAMEYVQGATLRQWLAREKPPLGRVVEVFSQAARGLASAHAAGLVHRDFKPENVLVGDDGRVRVTDFGLASVRARELPGPLSDGAPAIRLDTPLTLSGYLMGTPRYMAPEQHAAEPADARADQFAFCAALYEALTGTPAYPGSTYEELARNVRAGHVRIPAPDELAPAVWAVLERGLARQREARFPDLESLLAALHEALQRSAPEGDRAVSTSGAAAVSVPRTAAPGLEPTAGEAPPAVVAEPVRSHSHARARLAPATKLLVSGACIALGLAWLSWSRESAVEAPRSRSAPAAVLTATRGPTPPPAPREGPAVQASSAQAGARAAAASPAAPSSPREPSLRPLARNPRRDSLPAREALEHAASPISATPAATALPDQAREPQRAPSPAPDPAPHRGPRMQLGEF